MNVKIFDTHVRTQDGRYLHFDVLTEGGDDAQASRIAEQWLTAQGLPPAEITQSLCRFCHSEIGSPQATQAIRQQGFFIIPLQGF